MRILLIDDHDLFREGLKYLLPVLEGAVQYLEAGSMTEALQVAQPPGASEVTHIDLVLLDFHMPGVDGMEALRQCRQSFESATLVIVSGEEDPRIIRHAVDGGAAGFIPKSSSRDELVSALKLVLAGGTYLPPHALLPAGALQHASAPEQGGGDGAELLSRLSRRQFEVLMKAVQGKSNKVIAKELEISDHTVKAHLSIAFRQLDVQNRTEAVYRVARLGFQPGQAAYYQEAQA